MATVTMDPSVASFTPINMWAMLRALINNNCPLLTNPGTPTNGTSGTFAGQAGPGCLLIDYTNGTLYQNAGTLSNPTWSKFSGSVGNAAVTALSVNGAIPIITGYYAITKV